MSTGCCSSPLAVSARKCAHCTPGMIDCAMRTASSSASAGSHNNAWETNRAKCMSGLGGCGMRSMLPSGVSGCTQRAAGSRRGTARRPRSAADALYATMLQSSSTMDETATPNTSRTGERQSRKNLTCCRRERAFCYSMLARRRTNKGNETPTAHISGTEIASCDCGNAAAAECRRQRRHSRVHFSDVFQRATFGLTVAASPSGSAEPECS